MLRGGLPTVKKGVPLLRSHRQGFMFGESTSYCLSEKITKKSNAAGPSETHTVGITEIFHGTAPCTKQLLYLPVSRDVDVAAKDTSFCVFISLALPESSVQAVTNNTVLFHGVAQHQVHAVGEGGSRAGPRPQSSQHRLLKSLPFGGPEVC
ncbi:hypothetical protein B0I35DRAFT_91576 [Stachybotrys elegans]|uniref:Uncharacterized protein n=1 Tax=Stachybotrys elegans TaxID=80388 RepID=A0A8K0SJ68_9HYPO|nr:hypothetical protein B0I35DRAFT_91576 [Stachybotrys elegans]